MTHTIAAVHIGGNMTESTNLPENTQPGSNEYGASQRPKPEFGMSAPDAPGPHIPSWHPEANQSQAPAWPPARPVRTAENVGRGALFALPALPIGVVLWLVIWSFGWMSSLVTFAAAAMAARFYVMGAGGLSRKGVWVIAAITAATAILSFVAGVWLDAAKYINSQPLSLITSSEPWDLMNYNLANNPNFVKSYMGDFFMALLFGAVGCFFTLRRMFAATRNG